jgi:adenosylcobinamide-phosphate synthase
MISFKALNCYEIAFSGAAKLRCIKSRSDFMMRELSALISIAFLLDLLLGDPPYAYHPVRIIGRIIIYLEKGLRRIGWAGKKGGIILVLAVVSIVLSGYLSLSSLLFNLHQVLGLSFSCFLCYSCLAMGDLLNHIKPVVHSLKIGDLQLAKRSMGMLVGREVLSLDEQGLGRAAVETMAENFVDGFLSPLLWGLVGGVLASILGMSIIKTSISLMLVFKTASTLDSMVGYKNRTYRHFGWAGAKLDDVMNFVPARLSFFFLFLGACMAGLKPVQGLRVALRDRLKHDSPNAAHAESFVAGALGVRLGGPTTYPEGIKDKPWLGDGTPNVTTLHIHRTAVLLRCSAWTAAGLLLSPLFLF